MPSLPCLDEIGVLTRHPANPLLTAADVPYPCSLLFNAGVCRWQGRYVMVFRNDHGATDARDFRRRDAAGLPGFDGTNLGLATSADGVAWEVAPTPCIDLDHARRLWAAYDPHHDPKTELRRFYDPRLTVCEGRVYLCFAVDTAHGLRGGIATTEDFTNWELLSVSLPDNRNMALFPEQVGGRFIRFERPINTDGGWAFAGDQARMWLRTSPDLVHWGGERFLLSSADITWANDKMGPGAPPVKTNRGWLATFHGVWRDDGRATHDGWEERWPKIYSAGLMLLDLEDPSKILGRCRQPLLSPRAWYETGIGAPTPTWGFRRNVIFPGGMLLADDGLVQIYYGAADTVECLATGHVDDLVEACLADDPGPQDGV